MRRIWNKRLKRNILWYMKQYKIFKRIGHNFDQKFWEVPEGRKRNTRARMLVRAYAFQLRRKNDSRK